MNILKPQNPFTPGHPVGPELFIGRKKALETIATKVREARDSRRPELVVVAGPRGIGKTALQRYLTSTDENCGTDSIPSMLATSEVILDLGLGALEVNRLLPPLITAVGGAAAPYSAAHGIKEWFSTRFGIFEGVDIPFVGSIGVRMSQPQTKDLIDALRGISERLSKLPKPRVLTLTIDELDGLLDVVDNLAAFIKNVLEKAHCPVVFVLSGLPSALSKLRDAHPSISRPVREAIMLKPLDRAEVTELLKRALSIASSTGSLPITAPPPFVDNLFSFTGGHPYLVHEIGYRCIELVEPSAAIGLKEIPLTPKLLSAAQRDLQSVFATNAFTPWLKDLDECARDILFSIVDEQSPGQVLGRDKVVTGLQSKHGPDAIQEGTKSLERWGLVDSNLTVLSTAFVQWLRTHSMERGALAR
jgi:hypothetical protein